MESYSNKSLIHVRIKNFAKWIALKRKLVMRLKSNLMKSADWPGRSRPDDSIEKYKRQQIEICVKCLNSNEGQQNGFAGKC